MRKLFARIDWILRQQVEDELYRTKLGVAEVAVRARRRVVYLSGSIATASDRNAIVAIVQNIPGVQGIAESLEVQCTDPEALQDELLAAVLREQQRDR